MNTAKATGKAKARKVAKATKGESDKATKANAKAAKVTKAAKAVKAGKAAKVTKAKPVKRERSESVRRDEFGTELTGGMKWGTGLDVEAYLNRKVIKVADNTKRGASRERFAKYKVGKTLAQHLDIKGGPTKGDFRWDLGKGLITIAGKVEL